MIAGKKKEAFISHFQVRTNNPALIIEPSQGFLQAGHTQSISLSLDGAQKTTVSGASVNSFPLIRKK